MSHDPRSSLVPAGPPPAPGGPDTGGQPLPSLFGVGTTTAPAPAKIPILSPAWEPQPPSAQGSSPSPKVPPGAGAGAVGPGALANVEISRDVLAQCTSEWRDCARGLSVRHALGGGTALSFASETGLLALWFPQNATRADVSLGTSAELVQKFDEPCSPVPELLLVSRSGDRLAVIFVPSSPAVAKVKFFALLFHSTARSSEEAQLMEVALDGVEDPLDGRCCALATLGPRQLSRGEVLLLGGRSWFASMELVSPSMSNATRLQPYLTGCYVDTHAPPLSNAAMLETFLVVTLSDDANVLLWDGVGDGSPLAPRILGSRLSDEGVSVLEVALDSRIILLGGHQGTVVALDVHGEELWHCRVAGTAGDRVSCLKVVAPMLFVGYTSGLVTAIDMNQNPGDSLDVHECFDGTHSASGFLLTRSLPAARTLHWLTFEPEAVQNSWDPRHLVGQSIWSSDTTQSIGSSCERLAEAADMVQDHLSTARRQLLEVGASHAVSYVNEFILLMTSCKPRLASLPLCGRFRSLTRC
jgi:hypothetical protein